MRIREQLGTDLRLALRAARRAPGFTSVALITLIVGIAAVTSIFSYMNAVYFATLPYKDVDRLVALSERVLAGQGSGNGFTQVSPEALSLLRTTATSYERFSAYRIEYATVLFGSEPRSITYIGVDTSFIPLFDLRAEVGRLITPEEIRADAPVAMISDQLWRIQFGGDPATVGRSLAFGSRAVTIVGVLPPGFRFPWRSDAIIPLRETVAPDAIGQERDFAIVAKLRVGISRQTARTEAGIIAQRLSRPTDSFERRRYVPLTVRDEPVHRDGSAFLPLPGVFLGAGLFVLLIACGNVANLFLVRAAERSSEMAIRASLGATRRRLMGQMLTEVLFIGTVAAVVGTALSVALVKLGLRFIPTEGFPSWFHVSLDVRVLAFAIGVTLLVTLAVGMAPAREGSRFDLVRTLKRGGDGGAAASGVARSSRRGLAVQLAFAVALFIGAALFVRSSQRLSHVDLGYPAERIATVKPLYDLERYPEFGVRLKLTEQLAAQTAQIPGVTRVALRGNATLRSSNMAHRNWKRGSPPVGFDDHRIIPDGDSTRAYRGGFPDVLGVSDDYFSLLNLRIRQGRRFTLDDVDGSEPVTVINVALGRILWGEANPVGRRVQLGARGVVTKVIGVVDDARRLRSGREGYTTAPIPTLYYTTRQSEVGYPEVLATGQGDVVALRARIVELLRASDPTILVLRDVTLADQFGEALLMTRIFGGLIGIFAVAALGLALIGIYGVVAFGVERRTREIGIRLALGGTWRDVRQLIVFDSLRFVGMGLAAGVVLSLGLGRLITIFLFGTSPLDPLVYVAVGVLFGAVAVFACYLPARRVARVDPLIALRAE